MCAHDTDFHTDVVHIMVHTLIECVAQLWKLTTRFDFKENFRVLALN